MNRTITFTLLGILYVAALAQQPAPNTPVIHTGTRIVSVDVIVTDANGNLIHGLPASAFHVFEDNHLESIQDFTEHSFQPPPPAPPQSPDALGVFTNAKPHWDNKTLNVLVLDALNTPVQDQMFVHEQLTEFVKHAQPGEEIAILALNTHLILVQSPTSDPELLLQSIKSMTSLAISPLLGGGGPGGYVRARLRNDYTTDAFKDLQHYLSHLPGKKNVIYFSDGESYGYGPTGLTERTDAGVFDLPIAAPANYFVDASQASFFYISAHGLGGNGAISAEHGGGARDLAGRVYRENAINAYRMLDQQAFADALGGQAFFNSNDLAGETAYAIAAGANYYSLNYNPHGRYMDGREHTIRIVPENPGYQLTYRRHYVARAKPEPDRSHNDTPGTAPDAIPEATLDADTTLSPMRLSMQRGAAESTQLLFRERFVPLGNQPGGSVTSELAAGSSSDPKLKLKFRNFNLTFNADVSNIQTTPLPNGKLRMRVQFIALTYNLDCLLQTAISKELDGDVTLEDFAKLRNTGLPLTMQVSVPAGHDFYVRTGIQDLTSGYIGTLEVPTSLLEKLPALDQTTKK